MINIRKYVLLFVMASVGIIVSITGFFVEPMKGNEAAFGFDLGSSTLSDYIKVALVKSLTSNDQLLSTIRSAIEISQPGN